MDPVNPIPPHCPYSGTTGPVGVEDGALLLTEVVGAELVEEGPEGLAGVDVTP